MQYNLFSGMPNWMEERTVLFGRSGSFAYGLNDEDSDLDFKGVCIPPKSYFLGIDSFSEANHSSNSNQKNTSEDVDVKMIHINKFVENCIKGDLVTLELLFLEDDDYLIRSEEGERLIINKHHFLSKQMINKIKGYVMSQKKRVEKTFLKSQSEYDYDFKSFSHAIRSLGIGEEIFTHGTFFTKRPNTEFLMRCKHGVYAYQEAIELIDEYEQRLMNAYDRTKIQSEPDKETINKMLVNINERSLF